MAALDFGVPFAAVACTSTPTTIAGVKNAANQAIRCFGFNIGFDGILLVAPALIEIGQCTFATNSPGTNSTSVTPKPYDNGRPETIQSSAGKLWTAEPTVITIVEDFLIPVYMGSGIIFVPLSKPLIAKGGSGIVMRITLPSTVTANATGALKCEE